MNGGNSPGEGRGNGSGPVSRRAGLNGALTRCGQDFTRASPQGPADSLWASLILERANEAGLESLRGKKETPRIGHAVGLSDTNSPSKAKKTFPSTFIEARLYPSAGASSPLVPRANSAPPPEAWNASNRSVWALANSSSRWRAQNVSANSTSAQGAVSGIGDQLAQGLLQTGSNEPELSPRQPNLCSDQIGEEVNEGQGSAQQVARKSLGAPQFQPAAMLNGMPPAVRTPPNSESNLR